MNQFEWRLFTFLLFLFVFLSLNWKCESDEGVYSDTVGAPDGTIHLDLKALKTAHLTALVDGDSFAGSTNSITATFVGDFASSDPINIGSFTTPGQTYTRSYQLQREIGQLKGILLENQGYDSLLLAQLTCRIQSVNYQFLVPQTWLETWDPSLINSSNQDGYSPDADISLPSSSTLYLTVGSQSYDYTPQGLNTNPN